MAQMNEEQLETRYEGNVFARLFAYILPHRRAMILALLLVLAVTGIDLLRPVLIGNAIDTYIEGYNVPYEYVSASEAEATLGGLPLRRLKAEPADEDENTFYARLLYFEETYFLAEKIRGSELKELAEMEEDGLPGAEILPFGEEEIHSSAEASDGSS